jgi:hypothetical protein
MSVGDLVKSKEDHDAVFGIGLVVEEERSRVRVLWFPASEPKSEILIWAWKDNLEIALK